MNNAANDESLIFLFIFLLLLKIIFEWKQKKKEKGNDETGTDKSILINIFIVYNDH